MSLARASRLRFILFSGSSLAFLAAAPAPAQIYKWVDDKGVVNYSSEAPANRGSTLLDPKSARVSVYPAEDAQKRAPAASADPNESVLSQKIDRLERKLDAERYARGLSDVQMQTVAASRYEQCVRDRRVDCDYAGADPYPYYDVPYFPYYYGAVALARPHRPHANLPAHKHGAAPKPVGRPAFSSSRAAGPRQM